MLPLIHLLIPDTALRAALFEQLSLIGLGDIKESMNGVSREALADKATVFIIDEAALDKEILQALSSLSNMCSSFLLGQVSPDCARYFTETFPKPIRLGHLLARLKYHLEAAPRLRGTSVIFGPYRFEPHNRQVTIIATGTSIRLTEKETALLEYLGQSDKPVPRDELLTAIWGYDARIDTHTLETHIYQLRRKLAPDSSDIPWLLNEHGAYRLNRA